MKVILFVVGFITVVTVINLALFWVVGSAATSAIKSVSADCGKTYPVESFVNGNWFCPKEK